MAFPRVDLTYRNIQRYRQIINVFLSYGFGHLIERLELAPYVNVGRRLLRRGPTPFESLGFALRLRLVFEELGPTFVKLGQLLALQSATLPEELLAELSKLHDSATPLPASLVRGVIERALGAPIEEIFAEFDDRALAAASIAQVHRARLHDGTEVVAKVRRPGIVRLVRTDTDILLDLARLLARHMPELRRYDPVGLVTEVASTMLKEIDFKHEARNLELFARNMAEQRGIWVPALHGRFTTSDTLVLDFVDGIKIADVAALKDAGHDLRTIARNGMNAVLSQVFRDGFFHADPHPGNLFVIADGSIAPVDFGMMGRLSKELRDDLALLLVALVRKDRDGVIEFFARTDGWRDGSVPPTFGQDVDEILDHYHGIALGALDVNAVAADLFGALNRNNVHPPPQLVLLLKTLVMQEAIGRKLDPELDLIECAKPYIREILARRYSAQRLGGLAADAALEYVDLARVFPGELRDLASRLRTGRQRLVIQHDELDTIRQEVERASSRVTLGLVVGAVTLASAMLLSAHVAPTIWGASALGLLGLAGAGVGGFWLIVGILRSGRL